jgi:hypothetical protein
MNPRPKPRIMPWMSGRLVIFAIQVTPPVSPMISQKRPVNSPEAQMAPAVITLA